jgi:hypothetical protein
MIRTTHVGSLIRPAELLEFIRLKAAGQPYDQQAYANCLRASVAAAVRRQVEAGVDVVSDGEFGKSISWSQYALERLSGFERRAARAGRRAAPRGGARGRGAARGRPPPGGGLGFGGGAEFPKRVATAGELREPHRIARYLEDVDAAFHKFYDECRVLPRGDEDATSASSSDGGSASRTRSVFRVPKRTTSTETVSPGL